MNRGFAFAVLCLFLASSVLLAQEKVDPPVRPPQTDPAPLPGVLPGVPPLPLGGGPGFPMQTDYKELVATLMDMIEDADTDVRASVGQALAKIGRQSVTPLLDILKNKEKGAALRASAAQILGQIGPQAQEALPTLTKALKETDKDLRKRAAFAIANIVGDEFGGHGLRPGIIGPGGIGGVRGPLVPPKIVDPGNVIPDVKKPLEPEKKPIDPTKN